MQRNNVPLIGGRPTAPAPANMSPAAPSTSDNPVLEAARKANTALKKRIARPSVQQQPSVRILRLPPPSSGQQVLLPVQEHAVPATPGAPSGRGRSDPERHRGRWFSMFRSGGRSERSNPADVIPLPTVVEEESGRERLMVPRHVANKLSPHINPHAEAHGGSQNLAAHFAAHADGYNDTPEEEEEEEGSSRLRRVGSRAENAVRRLFSREQGPDNNGGVGNDENEYNSDMVDLLDVLDPEVSTLSTLTNVQNSLFVPSLGGYVNRRPTYKLTARVRNARLIEKLKAPMGDTPDAPEKKGDAEGGTDPDRPPLAHTSTISSVISESRYAVLPHGESLAGWTAEEKDELDDLVRHMLHSRRAKLKRSLKGFGQYVRRPLGLFVTVYATLITLFGLIWVLFLIGWISLGSKRDYVINVVDYVLVALFNLVGVTLGPFRLVDTYHMTHIARSYRTTRLRRKQLGLPELVDKNDLPHKREEDVDPQADIENAAGRSKPNPDTVGGAPWEYSVLDPEEQEKLEYHERKFAKSHTFYKPHETATHYAFPLRLLITVVLLLDMHSILQVTLGACTWGISYKTRPFALTTVILICSITCNITAGVLISVGDHRTRKKDVIERMTRQEITADAKEQIERRMIHEAEERGEIDRSERKEIEDELDEEQNKEIKQQWRAVPLLPVKLLGKQKQSLDHREPELPEESKSRDRVSSRHSLDSSRSHADKKAHSSHLAGRKSTHKDHRAGVGSSSAPISPAATHESSGARLGPQTTAQSSASAQAAPGQPPGPASKDEQPDVRKRDKVLNLLRKADMDMT